MIKTFLTTFLFITSVSFCVFSQDFTPTTAAEFQACLTTAGSNSQDDTITLPAGSFKITDNGNKAFTYDTTEDFTLTITGAGEGQTILENGGAAESNILTITTNSGFNADISISSLTIKNGYSPTSSGGGARIIMSGNGNVKIDGVTFDNSTGNDGGGLYVSTLENIELTNSTLTNNLAENDGGGFYLYSKSGNVTVTGVLSQLNSAKSTYSGGYIVTFHVCTVSNSTFNLNQNVIGGAGAIGGLAINSADADIFLSNLIVTNNYSDNSSFPSVGGLSVYNAGSSGTVSLYDSTIEQNQTSGSVGGLYISTGASSIDVQGNTISDNTATGSVGGFAISSATGNITFESNKVETNLSGSSLGGGYFNGQNIVFTNNLIANNQSSIDGAGVGFLGDLGTHKITNNTIVSNTSGANAGGLYIYPLDNSGTYEVYNNIIYNNLATTTGDDIYIDFSTAPSPTINVFNNNFTELCSNTTCDISSVLGSNQGDNLNVDPLFTDASNGDFTLTDSSPVIDAGSDLAPALPITDLDGNLRTKGNATDLGAYENQNAVTSSLSAGSGGGGCSLKLF